MFVDEVVISVIAGKGGDGCTSFRREKCMPMGGPDGGSGGRGANVIFEVDKGLKTLVDLRYMKNIKGSKGVNGKGSNRTGEQATDVVIKVPEGTTVIDEDTGLVIADLVGENNSVIVAQGGRGGRGNKAFATNSDPAPKLSEYGEPGEERMIRCELKFLADVGLVGMPSVGKSSLLGSTTGSKPKVGAYHFTTLSPNLGIAFMKDNTHFTIADLPGLIEGASQGVGLGHKFLKHAMRTKVLAHVLDMGSSEGRDPLEDYEIIEKEISNYSEFLSNKPCVVIANKMDLAGSWDHLDRFKKAYPDMTVLPVSTLTGEGLVDCLEVLNNLVINTESQEIYDESNYESHVIFRFKNEKPYTIEKDGDVWVLSGKEIEKLFKMTKFTEEASVRRFAKKLRGMGVDEELERLGAEPDDDVQILDYMFTFKD